MIVWQLTLMLTIEVPVQPFASVAVTVTVKGPTAVGVPEIAPLARPIDMPAGRPVAVHWMVPTPPLWLKVAGP